MSDQIKISCTVDSTDYSVPLGMRISLDNVVVYENSHVSHETQIQHDLADDDGEHELTFELFGKTHEHTQIDDAGNIVSDAMLSVKDIQIDGMDINYLVHTMTVYHHDFNGTQAPQQNKFFGSMGCNGSAKFKFTTPIYIWFLENM